MGGPGLVCSATQEFVVWNVGRGFALFVLAVKVPLRVILELE